MKDKQRILIIDDDKSLVLVAERLLQKEGYAVITAFSGLEGLQKAQAEKPDLVILDIVMPGMEGYEVCRQLKSNALTAHTPVIVLSVKGQTDTWKGAPAVGLRETSTAFNCGANNFLTKPVAANDLLRTVKAELSFGAFLNAL